MFTDRFTLMFIVVSIVIAYIEFLITFLSFRKKTELGTLLGLGALFAGLVNVTYLISTLVAQKMIFSVFTSIYFVCIDWMLVILVRFFNSYTKEKETKFLKLFRICVRLYLVFDTIVLLSNPLHHKAIDYFPRATILQPFTYEKYLLYNIHLGFSYVLVVYLVYVLVKKILTVPSNYRRQYIYILFGLIAIVGTNAIFLFIPHLSSISYLDISVWGYGIALYVVYWTVFDYSKHGMLDSFRNTIFHNIDQGIILFDYESRIILKNDKVVHILPHVDYSEDMTICEFIQQSELSLTDFGSCSYSVQCYVRMANGVHPVRCDYQPIQNDKKQIVGRLFVFTESDMDTDLLSGFQNWKSFVQFSQDTSIINSYPFTVAVCDINGLTDINNSLGRNTGDQMIIQLSSEMRNCFPEDTYFIRGEDAHLIALCLDNNERQVKKYLSLLSKNFQQSFQYGICQSNNTSISVVQAVQKATDSMREKKLLDRDSKHSNMLNSLIRALKECDDDTEAHVKRTQEMGQKLSERMNLSDSEQSNLSLLCILHDIGKIGVPLEILNKPGKLSSVEWKVLKSHVEKGYQIAKSSPELCGIADMILYHHERWDGKGYPDGLTRESIPLLSRMISVIDAYDAMVNNRSYRKALPKAVALEELKKNAGSQFDPVIVSEFIMMVQEDEFIEETVTESSYYVTNSQGQVFNDSDIMNNTHVVRYARYVLDQNNKIIQVDDNFTDITGYTKEEAMSLYQKDLIVSEDVPEYLSIVEGQLANAPVAFLEHRLIRKDGNIVYVICMGRVYFDSAARENYSEIIIADSTSTYAVRTMAHQEQLRSISRMERWENKYRCDSLTNLLNHEAFRSDVEIKLMSKQYKTMLLMMDVDRFKQYNDTFGHRAGDEFLILIAQSIESVLRKEDLACRMGGDEFACALFFDRKIGEDKMKERARQIFDKVNFTLTSQDGGTSLSMGLAISDDDTHNFNDLYEKADKALYVSKENGRHRLS